MLKKLILINFNYSKCYIELTLSYTTNLIENLNGKSENTLKTSSRFLMTMP